MAKKQTSKSRVKSGTGSGQIPATLAEYLKFNLAMNKEPERPTRVFAQVEHVFIAIDIIIKACRTIQMMLSTAHDEVVENGPAYDFLFGNPDLPISKFITDTAGYLSMYRECYWVFLEQDGRKPKQMMVVGPEQCIPYIMDGILVGYQLITVQGRWIPLLLDDVWPIWDFNPYQLHRPYHSIGPLEAGRISISAAYQSALMNESTMANGGRLSGLLSVPAGVKLDKEEKQALIADFESRHRGANAAGKWALATGGLQVQPFSQTMAELQIVELRKYDATTVFALFGVPPELGGLAPMAQYSHGPSQQRFILNTIGPMLAFIAENVSTGIVARFKAQRHTGTPVSKSVRFFGRGTTLKRNEYYRGAAIKAMQSNQNVFAWFNLEEHPSIQELQRERTEKVLKYRDAGIPLNQIIDAYDLPFETVPWGNDWWIPMGNVPARLIMESGLEGITGGSLPEGGDNNLDTPPADPPPAPPKEPKAAKESTVKTQNDPAKLRLWHNWVMSWAGIEREYCAAMRTYFMRQQKIVVAKLKKALGEKSIKDTNDEVVAKIQFDIVKENEKIRVINTVFYLKASELGIRQGLSEAAGLSGDALTVATDAAKRLPAIRNALITQSHKITSINAVTQRRLSDTLLEGLNKNEGLRELTDRVEEELGTNRARALSIARTQTAGAISTGRHAGFEVAEVELKSWVTSGDDHVRPTHRDAGDRYADGIPLNEAFWVGGEAMMHPGDPAASAANIVNCRCVEVALAAGGKTFTIEQWSNYKFYSYKGVTATPPEPAKGDTENGNK